MLTLLIFPGGRRADAVVLSMTEDHMRVAIAGRKDTTELSSVAGKWVTDKGVPVEFGAVYGFEGVETVRFRPRTLNAARIA